MIIKIKKTRVLPDGYESWKHECLECGERFKHRQTLKSHWYLHMKEELDDRGRRRCLRCEGKGVVVCKGCNGVGWKRRKRREDKD